MRWVLIALIATLTTIPSQAQVAQPVAVRMRPASGPVAAPRELVPIRTASNDSSGNIWTWIAVGALAGGMAGGIWAGAEISHEDDVFFPQLGVAMGVAAGMVGGGVLGAVAYAAHTAPPDSPTASSR